MPRVYMTYFLRDGWVVQFLEPDLKTPVGRIMTFATPAKVTELAIRGGALKGDPDVRHGLAYGIELGRGSIYLNLTDEQYEKLKQTRR